MILINKLIESDKGKTVFYKSFDGFETGILKSWNHRFIFVVYPGNNDAKKDHWDRYTGAATNPKDLFWNMTAEENKDGDTNEKTE